MLESESMKEISTKLTQTVEIYQKWNQYQLSFQLSYSSSKSLGLIITIAFAIIIYSLFIKGSWIMLFFWEIWMWMNFNFSHV